MKIEYHPAVVQDVAKARDTYKDVSQKLASEFEAEVRRIIAIAAKNPRRFHLIKPGICRANLPRFPFHVVYRELTDGIRVTLVRHNRRHPASGMHRK